jgi:integrase
MSAKYSKTAADYLTWDQNLNLIRWLHDDGQYKISLLISLGSFLGLRISDLLGLTWGDILEKDEFSLQENKTGKTREIKINDQLQRHIKDCHEQIKPRNLTDHIFTSQKGSVYSIQRVNVIFKNLKRKYNLQINNFSTHSMRKAFGRAIFQKSGTNAELALVKLSQLFNHSNVGVTKRYLGISKEELMETYDLLSF